MMGPNARLRACALIIIASAIYAVLVAQNPNLAGAVASGYIALLLTVMFVLNVWKKP